MRNSTLRPVRSHRKHLQNVHAILRTDWILLGGPRLPLETQHPINDCRAASERLSPQAEIAGSCSAQCGRALGEQVHGSRSSGPNPPDGTVHTQTQRHSYASTAQFIRLIYLVAPDGEHRR